MLAIVSSSCARRGRVFTYREITRSHCGLKVRPSGAQGGGIKNPSRYTPHANVQDRWTVPACGVRHRHPSDTSPVACLLQNGVENHAHMALSFPVAHANQSSAQPAGTYVLRLPRLVDSALIFYLPARVEPVRAGPRDPEHTALHGSRSQGTAARGRDGHHPPC